ncbi:MAG: methyltransferase [Gammaproteobacteria bacterium SG8_31]|nr:MAG: methyltransferase [Gammaproteobacteria bacterium SG8_31]
MDLFHALTIHQPVFVGLVFVLGLMVGSFLNVVIYRLPVMLDRSWRAQCAELTGHDQIPSGERFDLIAPPSTCPECGHRITFRENIPVVSFLFLGGKCSACRTRISRRYPAVELGTALLSVLVAWRLGTGWPCLFALLFTWSLIALSGIDLDTKLLPDTITLPLLWLGLLVNLGTSAPNSVGTFASLHDAVLGAVAGYLSLWLVYHLFRLVTGKEGMGYGDFKLLAAIGAWLGWQYLPLTILLSAVVGAIVGGAALSLKGRESQTPIPFGPFLAAAGWIAMMWGSEIMDAYLTFSGLR